jgi:hypothetical protein
MYPADREEYDLDGEDGNHHVDGVPAGHEDEEVVDETDPRDMEMAAWSNEQPAALGSLPTFHRRDTGQESEPMEMVRAEDLAPQVHEEPDEPVEAMADIREQQSPRPDSDARESSTELVSDASDSGISTGGNESDNEDNDIQMIPSDNAAVITDELDELDDTSMPPSRAMSPLRPLGPVVQASPSPGKIIAPTTFKNDVVPGEWKEGMALKFSQTRPSASSDPLSTDVPETQEPEPTAIPAEGSEHGQDTGYMGDDELPVQPVVGRLSDETADQGDDSNSVTLDAVNRENTSKDGETASYDAPLHPTGEDLTATHVLEDNDEPAITQTLSENDAPISSSSQQQSVVGHPALTDENLAQVAAGNEPTATGGDLLDSCVGTEEVSTQSVTGINEEAQAENEGPSDATQETKETISNRAEGETTGPESGETSRPSQEEPLTTSVDGPMDVEPGSSGVQELSFTDLIHTPVDSPRIEEDMFDVSGVTVLESTDAMGVTGPAPEDPIEVNIRNLPSPPAGHQSPTPEPHLPIDREDPALAMMPAVLQEQGYARANHHDHVAEALHQAHEAHRRAFEAATGQIGEDPSQASAPAIIEILETPSAEIVNMMLGMPRDEPVQAGMQASAAQSESANAEEFVAPGVNSDDASQPMIDDIFRSTGPQATSAVSHDAELDRAETSEPSSAAQARIDEIFEPVEDGSDESANLAKEEAAEPLIEEGHEEARDAMMDRPSSPQSQVVDDDEPLSHDNENLSVEAERNTGSAATLQAEEPERSEEGDEPRRSATPSALAQSTNHDEIMMVDQPHSVVPSLVESGPASVIPIPTVDQRNAQQNASPPPPQTPPTRPRELDLRTPELTHHHHGPVSTAPRSTLHESERMLHAESPASHTRSQCHYHKMRFDRGAHSHTMLIPGCSLGSATQRAELDVEDLGKASSEEMKRKQSLLFGENFLGHMKSEEEGTLPSDLEHRLSVLVGRELIREGHIYILPLEQGMPHTHAEEEEEDGGIASRTRRRTSQTPGPGSGLGLVTPVREGDKKRKHRGSSVGRTPVSAGKKRASELLNVQEVKEESEDEVKGDEQGGEREDAGPSSKKRIVEVDGSPKAVDKEDDDEDEVVPTKRDRDEEDGDRMDVDERVDQSTDRQAMAPARKGWFGWLWGRK